MILKRSKVKEKEHGRKRREALTGEGEGMVGERREGAEEEREVPYKIWEVSEGCRG